MSIRAQTELNARASKLTCARDYAKVHELLHVNTIAKLCETTDDRTVKLWFLYSAIHAEQDRCHYRNSMHRADSARDWSSAKNGSYIGIRDTSFGLRSKL
jgi:hypothetical protein